MDELKKFFRIADDFKKKGEAIPNSLKGLRGIFTGLANRIKMYVVKIFQNMLRTFDKIEKDLAKIKLPTKKIERKMKKTFVEGPNKIGRDVEQGLEKAVKSIKFPKYPAPKPFNFDFPE